MPPEHQIRTPAGFGGLIRYTEEYSSKFMLKPTHVIGFVVFIILFRVALGIFL